MRPRRSARLPDPRASTTCTPTPPTARTRRTSWAPRTTAPSSRPSWGAQRFGASSSEVLGQRPGASRQLHHAMRQDSRMILCPPSTSSTGRPRLVRGLRRQHRVPRSPLEAARVGRGGALPASSTWTGPRTGTRCRWSTWSDLSGRCRCSTAADCARCRPCATRWRPAPSGHPGHRGDGQRRLPRRRLGSYRDRIVVGRHAGRQRLDVRLAGDDRPDRGGHHPAAEPRVRPSSTQRGQGGMLEADLDEVRRSPAPSAAASLRRHRQIETCTRSWRCGRSPRRRDRRQALYEASSRWPRASAC